MIRLTPVKATGAVKVTFALPTNQPPGQCSGVGDFNDWSSGTHELRRRANGITVQPRSPCPPGPASGFRYLAEDGRWFNDTDITDFDGPDTAITV